MRIGGKVCKAPGAWQALWKRPLLSSSTAPLLRDEPMQEKGAGPMPSAHLSFQEGRVIVGFLTLVL